MDYELQNQTRISDDTNRGMIYGSMPNALLMAKFEETNIDDHEGAYDDYARGLAADFGPDTNMFAHEEVRVNTGANGTLQLRYNGHRGDEEVNYRPEQFGGFGEHDPRGHNVDPDMKQYTEQAQARARFQLWTPDSNESITGGGISETQIRANKQLLFKDAKSRLKIFDRQLDGSIGGKGMVRNNGASNVQKQLVIKSYSNISENATPMRRANIMAKEIIRDTKRFRAETIDQSMEVQKYGGSGRRQQKKSAGLRMQDADLVADSDKTLGYKAVGLLMANLVRAKAINSSGDRADIDMGQAHQSIAVKTAIISKDITAITRAMKQEGDFGVDAMTMQYKTAGRTTADHLATVIDRDHDLPAHHLLNAEVIYKNYAGRGNMRRARDEIITDSKHVITREHMTSVVKSAGRHTLTGRKLATANDTDATDGKTTASYKQARRSDIAGARVADIGDGQKYEHAMGQMRRTTNSIHTNPNAENIEQMTGYDDNNFGNRHGGRLGSKYTRHHDRDGVLGLGETGLLTS